MEYVLEANGLCKRYHNFAALNGLDMHIPKGAIYGFVGRNGAGKTTLIRLICGLQEPTSGSHSLYGTSSSDPRSGRARRRMGAVVETPSIYLDLSAEENLRLQSRLLGLPSERGIGELLRLVGLGGTGRKKARDFARHASAARHCRGAQRKPGPARARRADKRARPTGDHRNA